MSAFDDTIQRRAAPIRPAITALLAFGALGLSVAASPVAAEPERVYRPSELAKPSICRGTKVIVYASRGSSENPQQQAYHQGLGSELDPIWAAIEGRYGTTAAGRRAKLVTNRAPQSSDLPKAGTDPLGPSGKAAMPGYPAVGAEFEFQTSLDPASIATYYAMSVQQGTASAVRDLTALREGCRTAKLLVIGFSEGAEVSRRALAALRLPDRGSATAILFGDVTWGSGETGLTYLDAPATSPSRGLIRALHDGDFTAGAAANYRAVLGKTIPSVLPRWQAASICDPFDLACQFGALGANPWPHTRYGEDDSEAAADRAVQILGA